MGLSTLLHHPVPVVVRQRFDRHGLDRHRWLGDSVKELTPRSRGAAVELERELVRLVLDVGVADGALMRAQEPAFAQCHHPMDPRQQLASGPGGLAPAHADRACSQPGQDRP